MSPDSFLGGSGVQGAILRGILETLGMTVASGVITALIGIPIGVLLYTSSPTGTAPRATLHRVLGAVVNVGRSMPFLILMVALIPVTRIIVGTTIGWQAAVVPLTVGAVPFYARLVETSLHEIPGGKVEAVTMMGATQREITRKVLLPEARPGLVSGLTTTIIALIGYTAMAGAIGAGGLGAVAMRYGYSEFEPDVMAACVVLLLVIVTAVQVIGDRTARRLDRR